LLPQPPDFGAVTGPAWDDKPVLIVGAGPSLKGFDFERLRGLGHVLAIKQTHRDLPFADACFGLDLKWMEWARDELADLAQRLPLYLAVPPGGHHGFQPIPGAIYLKRLRENCTFATALDTIESGCNSGFGGFNLAWHKRPRQVVLFGFDFAGDHYAPEHYNRPAVDNSRYLKNWARIFETTLHQWRAIGASVLNASPASNIACFPKCTIDEAIDRLQRGGL
jgi:hypothetical protein